MAMENGPVEVEDVFPTENGDFSIAMLVYWRTAAFFLHHLQTQLERETHPTFLAGGQGFQFLQTSDS